MEVWEEIGADTEKGAQRLVAEFWDRLFGASLVLCKEEHLAEDLVFRTFAQAIVKIDQYDASLPFWNWLYAILLNYFRADLRKMKAEVGETLTGVGGGLFCRARRFWRRRYCRPAFRDADVPTNYAINYGFRVTCSAELQ